MGVINLDVQFLPDVTIDCPDCGGSRYQKAAADIVRTHSKGKNVYSLPALMKLSVNEALDACDDLAAVRRHLQILHDLGLGYLTLGEAQRLKLVSDMGKGQEDFVFVFDEPTIGLHPLNTKMLRGVFQTLMESSATVIVIEHDLDVIRGPTTFSTWDPEAARRAVRLSPAERSRTSDRIRRVSRGGIFELMPGQTRRCRAVLCPHRRRILKNIIG